MAARLFVDPVPSLVLAVTASLVEGVSISQLAPFSWRDADLVWALPLFALLGIALYGVVLVMAAGGDPRRWRDAARFDRVLDPQRSPDPIGDERARAAVWHAGSRTMGTHAGFVAAMPQFVIIGERGFWLGAAAFATTFLIVRWIVTRLVAAPERAALHPLLGDIGR